MSMQRATVAEKIRNMGPMSGGASPTAGKGATICLHLKDVELMWIGPHTRTQWHRKDGKQSQAKVSRRSHDGVSHGDGLSPERVPSLPQISIRNCGVIELQRLLQHSC